MHLKTMKYLIISFVVVLIALFGHPQVVFSSNNWIDVSTLEDRLDNLKESSITIDARSIELLDAVEKSILKDLEGSRQDLIKDIEKWNRDIDSATVEELNYSVDEALIIAGKNGLPVAKLKRIFELTKKIIRDAEFVVPNFVPPDKESFKQFETSAGESSVVTATRTILYDHEAYFNTLYSYVQSEEDAIAAERAQQQEFRVRLYKRATLAFIKALLASREQPPSCLPSARTKMLIINGNNIPTINCPDPVIDNLRDYLDAIRKIASADSPVLVADAEMVVAEQQLAADLMAGIPVVGDFLDVYSVYAGENIAGVKLSDAERGLCGAMLVLPLVGPAAADVLQQGVKRVPGYDTAVTAVHDTLSYLLKRGGETAPGMMVKALGEAASDASRASFEAYQATAKTLAKEWNTTVDALDDILVSLGSRPDKSTRFLNQALEEAAYGRRLIAELPQEARLAARLRSQEIVDSTLGKLKLGREASGVVNEHMDAMLAVARKHDEIYIVRPVNSKATHWIEMGYSTKPMPVKAKSASHGPFAGLIPADAKLNKIGSKIDEAKAALKNSKDAAERVRIQTDIDELEKALSKQESVITKCRNMQPKCATEVEFKLDDIKGTPTVHQVKGPTGETKFAVLEDGKWLDAEALQSGSKVDIGFTPSENNPVMLLADEDGIPYTADYDFLNFAQNKPHQRPGINEATGYISKDMNERLPEINTTTRKASEEARNKSTRPVSHHGAEQLNPYTPGVDYPLTMIDGRKGEIFVVPSCDTNCMQKWCHATQRCDPRNICGKDLVHGCVKIDPDRLLKDYYHDSRLAGYTLDPNPKWGWDDYNGLSGWTHPEIHGTGGYSWPVYSAERAGKAGAGRGIRRLDGSTNQEGSN